ncbi:hypothetical protein CJA_0220 [Cellvibrio japonicus Ueda107]|uniref:Uncharacterized protein n=1 Tax=Cellvibrio japonicus (strain Ueda107) TaxID=498211 RepID=B3PGG5_CELJU|nr:hypothetical protein CJA_0220 [Cellvibrio japonicus Ueda107]
MIFALAQAPLLVWFGATQVMLHDGGEYWLQVCER